MAAEVSTNKSKPKLPELLIINANQIIRHCGPCKIQINALSKILLVTPENEDFKLISVPFGSESIKQNNILCIFNADKIHNLVIIFKNPQSCATVYNKVFNEKTLNNGENDSKKIFIEKFIHPLCDTLLNREASNDYLHALLIDIIKSCDEVKKEEMVEILKRKNIYNQLFPGENVNVHVVNQNQELVALENRKRRAEEVNENRDLVNEDSSNCSKYLAKKRRVPSDMNSNKSYQKLTCSNSESEETEESDDDDNEDSTSLKQYRPYHKRTIVKSSNFKIIQSSKNGESIEKLIIFDSNDRSLCHEYLKDSKSFVCQGCNSKSRKIRAKILENKNGDGDENEKFVVELLGNDHICTLKKYKEKIIITKLNYKITEEYINGINGKKAERLIIFDELDRNLCYKYAPYGANNMYYCCGCKQRNGSKAEVINKGTKDEYFEINEIEHVCDMPVLYSEDKEFGIVKSPNFEIQKYFMRGNDRQKLVIFYENDRNLCYEYQFTKDLYVCYQCKRMNTYTSAKLCQNKENGGEDFVRLGKTEHVCKPISYKPPMNIEIIALDQSKYIYKETANGYGRLYVFANEDKKFCYEYARSTGSDDFYCLGCKNVKTSDLARVNVPKNEAGEITVHLKNQKHLCKPRKYIEEPETIVNVPNFKFYKKDKSAKFPNLILFTDNQTQKKCYSYFFQPRTYLYFCSKCITKKNKVSARIFKNENGSEFIRLGNNSHICKPRSYLELKNENKILSCSGIDFEKLRNKKDENEKGIIKAVDFEFQRNKHGILKSRLIIFYSENKNLCYEYYLNSKEQKYFCCKCLPQGKTVTAKFYESENYIKLNEIKHICEPVKYESQTDVVRKPQFIVMEPNIELNNLKIQTMFVFTSMEQKFCYRYSYDLSHKLFKCVECQKDKRSVSAKICMDDNNNGEEYVHFGQTKHVCEPQEYIPPEFKIYSSADFELLYNSNGVAESKITLWLNNESSYFGYEYLRETPKSSMYYCVPCSKLNKHVTAKLFQNEKGENQLKILVSKHICNGTNLVEKGKIIKNGFKSKINSNGNKILKVQHVDDESLYYKFRFDSNSNTFICDKCNEKEWFVTAKICKRINNEKEFLLLNNRHYCTPFSVSR